MLRQQWTRNKRAVWSTTHFHLVSMQSLCHTATVLTKDGQRTSSEARDRSFLDGRRVKLGHRRRDNSTTSATQRIGHGRHTGDHSQRRSGSSMDGEGRRRDGAATSCRVMHEMTRTMRTSLTRDESPHWTGGSYEPRNPVCLHLTPMPPPSMPMFSYG